MKDVGRVLEVSEFLPGSTAGADAPIGTTDLPVASTEDFSEDGGTITVHGAGGIQTYTYGTPDDEALTLPLDSPTTATIQEGDEVIVPGAVSRYANVRLQDDPDVPVLARVPHALVGRLPGGAYADDDLDAVTIAELTPGNWEVVDVLGRELARAGIHDTDWRNDRGVRLIGGDVENGVSEMLFSGWDFIAENQGPVSTSIPSTASGDLRRVGRTGASSGAITVTTDFPVKVTVNAQASCLNGDPDDGFNIRFYIVVVDPATSVTSPGRQGTQWLNAGDQDANRHRQVTRSRHVWWNATPDDPQTRNFWWGFKNDTGVSHNVELRNMQMVFRLSYAPDYPDPEDPEDTKVPTWTDHADTIESYLRAEPDDIL